jgi:hypothetical protein
MIQHCNHPTVLEGGDKDNHKVAVGDDKTASVGHA